MSTMIVWLLISVSNTGAVATVERFPSEADCMQVRQHIPRLDYLTLLCVQTKVAR